MQRLLRIHILFLWVVASAFLLCFSSACDDGILDDGNKLVFPEEGEISFINNVLPFLRLRCANSTCHGSVSPAGGRAMVDYATIMNPVSNVGFIKPYDSEGSLFYQVAAGINPHLQNIGQRQLTENQQQGIKKWIDSGALNN